MSKEKNTASEEIIKDENQVVVVDKNEQPINDIEKQIKLLKSRSNRRTIFIILLVILLNSSLFIFFSNNIKNIDKPIDYSSDINNLKKNIESNKLAFNEINNKLSDYDKLIGKDFESLNQNYAVLSNRIDMIKQAEEDLKLKIGDQKHFEKWKIQEIKYLVSLAERKLQIDQDIKTCISLLESIDNIVVSLDDPRSYNLRQSIQKDINVLGNIKTIDYEKVLFKINELISNIDIMRFSAKNNLFNQEDDLVSSDIDDWKSNISKSFNQFLDNFIKIKKVGDDSLILTKDYEVLIKESIKLKLLLAQKAFYSNNFEFYKSSLEQAQDMIKKYFDNKETVVLNTLNSLTALQSEYKEKIVVPQYLNTSISVRDYLKEVGENKE